MRQIGMINSGRIVALDSPERLKASVTGDRVVEVSFSCPTPRRGSWRTLPGVVEVHRLGDKYRTHVSRRRLNRFRTSLIMRGA